METVFVTSSGLNCGFRSNKKCSFLKFSSAMVHGMSSLLVKAGGIIQWGLQRTVEVINCYGVSFTNLIVIELLVILISGYY
jgi:hypothetical protein